jgi:type IV pilus assembly protein PilA
MQREHPGARGLRRREQGFTLIELMMVVLIIAILVAVLIPVLLGASTRAKDRAAQTRLRDALTAAKTVFADGSDYTLATPAALTLATGALVYVDGSTAPTTQNTVSVEPVSANYIVFGGQSKTGACFYVADDASGTGTLYAQLPGAGGCAAGSAPLPGDVAWKKNW